MGASDESNDAPERRNLERRRLVRRKKGTADLRIRLDEVARQVSSHPLLTEDDLIPLYGLMRDYYQRGLLGSSYDMLQVIRERHADEFSPPLLALLDKVMGRG